MAFDCLSSEEIAQLNMEVVSHSARLRLTRQLRSSVSRNDTEVQLACTNAVVNIARNQLGLPLYILEADVDGFFHAGEHAWHNGELEICMRRPSTPDLVCIIADLVESKWLDCDNINAILEDDSCGFHLKSITGGDVCVVIDAYEDIEPEKLEKDHPNIRFLAERMQREFDAGDFSAVVHSAGSIFETLAKDVVGIPSVQDQSLGGFFDRYCKDSKLPSQFLDYIKAIFDRRNTEPLSGHGSLVEPTVNKEEAAVIIETSKAVVRIERLIAEPEVSPPPSK